MTRQFTIDRDRFERFRAEADAAQSQSRSAEDRVNEAHDELREAEEALRVVESSYRGPTQVISLRDETGTAHNVSEEHRELYLNGARNRVAKAKAEVARLARSQNEGAGAREHAIRLFSRLSAFEKGFDR